MIRYSTLTERNNHKSYAPVKTLAEAIRKVKAGEADGLTVDVVLATGDIHSSYEVQPGREVCACF